jgi:DUF3096 family protein
LRGGHVAARLARQPNASRPASFREQAIQSAAFSGNYCGERNRPRGLRVSYFGTHGDMVPAPDDSLHHRSNVLTITTAHIPAIVALIAGLLILIMPRLLNFIVAIYLIVIGLVGLGLLRWLHM